MNAYLNNTFLIILILLISIVPFLIINKGISQKRYGLALLSISVALILHRSLISSNLWGVDIFAEYYFANLVNISGYWDMGIYSNLNAILSIVLLPNIVSELSGIDLVTVLKVIYPLIFALVPLAIYEILRKMMDHKIAFLSATFFIFMGEFYGVMPAMARQEIGELFFILLILLIMDSDIAMMKKVPIFVIFAASLTFSHYALEYIFMYMVAGMIILLWIKRRLRWGISDSKEPCRIFGRLKYASIFMLFLGILAILYYFSVAGQSVYNALYEIIVYFLENAATNFLNPNETEGLGMAISPTTSAVYSLLKYSYAISYFLIGLGILSLLIKLIPLKCPPTLAPFRKAFDDYKGMYSEYAMMSLMSFSLMVAIILVPNFAGNLGTIRIFHITSLLLSPFLIAGATVIAQYVTLPRKTRPTRTPYGAICTFLIIFFLLNSGLVHELTHDPNPASISLSKNEEYRGHTSLYLDSEITGAEFIQKMRKEQVVFSDHFSHTMLRGYVYPWISNNKELKEATRELSDGSWVYFRNMNLDGNLYVIPIEKKSVERPLIDISTDNLTYMDGKSKIYHNGGSAIWY